MRSLVLISLICLAGLIWPKGAWAASFSLSPASATQGLGTVFPVDIILDTGSEAVSGATAIINYDTVRLQVQDDDNSAAGVQIQQGAIFNQTPLTNTVNTTTGQIRYDSGSLGTSYTGRGVMATIHFKPIAAGTAAVTFVFNSNSTIDTSLVAAASGPTSLLTTVSDGSYTIATASGSTGGTTQVLLPSGVVENTIAALVGGIIFIALGIIFAKRAVL